MRPFESIQHTDHVPAAHGRTIDEALAYQQTASRGVLKPIQEPSHSGPPHSLPVAAFSHAHGTAGHEHPPPRRVEHTGEILAEFQSMTASDQQAHHDR